MTTLRNTDAIFVAGHRGMVGSAIIRNLNSKGFTNIVTIAHGELNLLEQRSVQDFFHDNKIDYVVLAAAKVGGILANNKLPAQFIYENLMIECNVIHAAYQANVKRLLFLGSSCIYPKFSTQPIAERDLLTGALESTNEPYAVAKIAGIKLCESYNRQYGTHFRSVMPTNLYGEGDNFHPTNSHVIPALIQRFHEAKVTGEEQVVVWGTGNAKREFLHMDDMGAACVHVMMLDNEVYESNVEPMISHVNVGTGKDVTIREMAEVIKRVVGFEGELVFDTRKPDGTPQKLLNVSRLTKLGWTYSIELEEGLYKTYQWYVANLDHGVRVN